MKIVKTRSENKRKDDFFVDNLRMYIEKEIVEILQKISLSMNWLP